MALTEDCLYSQVIRSRCYDQGVLRIPILSIKDIRQQACKIIALIINKKWLFFIRF
jgi:hypothetical protein